MIIAIDGPAGSGKSTIANLIADRLKFDKLDTGAMYRTVAFVCASSGIDLDDEKAVTACANDLTITFDTIDGMQHVFADGKDVSREIRTPETDRIVSKVSAYPDVRKALLRCQRHFAATRNVVAEGRDIGTVVFPQAEVKVFLTADPRERARRRVLQRLGGTQLDQTEIDALVEKTLADIERRDDLDSHRAVAPLRAADDAYHIDSSSQSIEAVCDKICALVKQVS